MGFFFETKKKIKAKSSSKKAPSAPKGAKGLRDIKALNRLQCRVCPLADVGPKVPATIPKKSIVYFLGEAPGATEERNGKPFVGKSGALLRSTIPDELEGNCAFGNTVLHRPPNNRTPEWQEIECCRNFVIASIEEAKPKVIIGLGIPALQWVLDSVDMQGMRGRAFPVTIGSHTCWFIPTYHPSFILRQARDEKSALRGKFGSCFDFDLQRAYKLALEGKEAVTVKPAEAAKGVRGYDGAPGQLSTVVGLILKAASAKYAALDYETTPGRAFRKNPKIYSVAISFGDIDFSFALDHPKARWSKSDRKKLLATLRKFILSDCVKIAHNAPFEIEWTMAYLSADCIRHDKWIDTMGQAQLIDERKGGKTGEEDEKRTTYQSLGFLTKLYFGLDIKTLSHLRMAELYKEPLPDILRYNATDTRFTLKLFYLQRERLRELGLQKYFDKEVRERQPTVAIMQFLGVPVSQKMVLKNQQRLEKRLDKIHTKISAIRVVKQYKKDHGHFNPQSPQDLIKIFDEYLKRSEIRVPKKYEPDKFDISVKDEVLKQIDHPLAKIIPQLRTNGKLKSTYVDEFVLGSGRVIYPDGRLHTSFNTTFAQSGRLSSDGPNLQNFPKRNDVWIRRCVVPKKGHVLVSIDYGQLEWCTATMCTRDKVMIEITETEYDVHAEWARRLAKKYPSVIGGTRFMKDKDVMKKLRSKVKNKFVFPTIFGATSGSIAGYLTIPEEIASRLHDDFFEQFEGLHSWQNKLMKEYYQTGEVKTLLGRPRRYPMTRNEAINHPIQGTAAEIVCDAMVRLSKKSIREGNPYVHPVLNIHDDLTFMMPDSEEMDEHIAICVKEMLSIPYSFVNVPMAVEVSVGHNWEKMEEIGKFWSHRDI